MFVTGAGDSLIPLHHSYSNKACISFAQDQLAAGGREIISPIVPALQKKRSDTLSMN